MRSGAPILCDACMDHQRPIVAEWNAELRQLIKRFKDRGLVPGWMFTSFHFLTARIFDAYREPGEVYLKTGRFSPWLNNHDRFITDEAL